MTTPYEELSAAISNLMAEVGDPNDWDGDADEGTILVRFLSWVPDMVRHQAAEDIRAAVDRAGLSERSPVRQAALTAADQIDPFKRSTAGQWVRRDDPDIPVPWPVVKD